jgi:hypothetical protein
VYQIAGYVFSPPYNAWEPRPGLIKVIDGTHDAPAVVLDSIDGMLYAGQGRHVTGCVDAPAGSTLEASFHVDGDPDDQWRAWLSDMPIERGAIDLCFESPEPALGGLVHIRVVVTAPDGTQSFASSKDALALFGTAASCTPSAALCCPAPDAADAGVSPPPMRALPDASMPSQPPAGAPRQQPAGEPTQQPVGAQAPHSAAAGCTLAAPSSTGHAGSAIIASAFVLVLRRSRLRRSRG